MSHGHDDGHGLHGCHGRQGAQIHGQFIGSLLGGALI